MTQPDETFLRKLNADLEVVKERQTWINGSMARLEKALEPVPALAERVKDLEEDLEPLTERHVNRYAWVPEIVRFVITGFTLTAIGWLLNKFGVELVVF